MDVDIACLLSLTDDSGARLLSEEEIVDTAMVSLTAGHDTSSILPPLSCATHSWR